jgi:hypothetical protein
MHFQATPVMLLAEQILWVDMPEEMVDHLDGKVVLAMEDPAAQHQLF